MSDVTPSHSESEVDDGLLNLRSRKYFRSPTSTKRDQSIDGHLSDTEA